MKLKDHYHRLKHYFVHAACKGVRPEFRKQIFSLATGTCFECGFGSGLSLDYYNSRAIDKLLVAEPSDAAFHLAKESIKTFKLPIERVQVFEDFSYDLPDNSMDTIITFMTLCSVKQIDDTLSELYRILKPGGQYLFFDHGLHSQKKIIQKTQESVLNSVWAYLAAGCQLNKPITEAISKNGFTIKEQFYKDFTNFGNIPILQLFPVQAGIATK